MQVVRPRDVDEATAALAEFPDATLLAGGTDLMVDVNFGRRRPDPVVSLRGVDDLRTWDGRFVGAGVTYRRMEHGPHPALAQLARTVGSPQIRNAGTLGGNLGTASPAGDALPFLAAVDAEVVLRSAEGGERCLDWQAFLTGPKQTARTADEVIVGVRLPAEVPVRQAFAKVGTRTAMVISMVSAVVTRDDAGAVTVALGAVGPTPLRAPEAEVFASSLSRPSRTDLDEFARLVSAAARPIDDHRASAAYRRHAAGILAARLLEKVSG